MPALPARMGMGSFLRNGSCTHQFWIELTIAFRACRERPPDFSWLVTLDDIDRGGFARSVFKNEFGGLRVRLGCGFARGGGDIERAEAVAGKRAAQLTDKSARGRIFCIGSAPYSA